MLSIAKSQATMRMIKERLNFRFADQALSCADSFDSEGFPVLTLSDGSALSGEKVLVIRCKQQDAVSKDIFGNAHYAYSPHVIQVAYELPTAAPVLIASDWAKAIMEIGKVGMLVEIYARAFGAIPAVADMVVGKLESSLEFDVLWPTKGN